MQIKNKWIIISLITSLLSFVLSYAFNQGNNMNQAIVPTIYTLSGIMFSIGMGIVCTFNPSPIKNKQIFQRIRVNIANVRNSFLIYFSLSTVTFLVSQVLNRNCIYIVDFTIIFDPQIFALSFSLVSIVYFIINFLTVQKLIFDIAERIMEEDK